MVMVCVGEGADNTHDAMADQTTARRMREVVR